MAAQSFAKRIFKGSLYGFSKAFDAFGSLFFKSAQNDLYDDMYAVHGWGGRKEIHNMAADYAYSEDIIRNDLVHNVLDGSTTFSHEMDRLYRKRSGLASLLVPPLTTRAHNERAMEMDEVVSGTYERTHINPLWSKISPRHLMVSIPTGYMGGIVVSGLSVLETGNYNHSNLAYGAALGACTSIALYVARNVRGLFDKRKARKADKLINL